MTSSRTSGRRDAAGTYLFGLLRVVAAHRVHLDDNVAKPLTNSSRFTTFV